MAYKPCPNPNPECPYFNKKPIVEGEDTGCFSDQDHIVPKRLAKCALSTAYIKYLPENQQQICRWEHDKKTAEGDEPLPDRTFMHQRIVSAVEQGIVQFSKTRQRKLGLNNGKT